LNIFKPQQHSFAEAKQICSYVYNGYTRLLTAISRQLWTKQVHNFR